MATLREQFARRLKALRAQRGLTQDELAKAIGRSASLVSSLERGIDATSFETLDSLAKALGVAVRDLFEFGVGPTISAPSATSRRGGSDERGC